MMQFLDATFLQSAPKAKDAHKKGSAAILPQQPESEIQAAEIHSKLDRVLNFLTREVGYCFVADAKPSRGGTIALQEADCALPPPWRNTSKSARLPKLNPSSRDKDSNFTDLMESAFAEADMSQFRIGPEAAKYAHYPDDLILVARFAKLLVKGTPAVADKIRHQDFYKRILQGVRLMHLCDFNYSDVVVTLAYASVYFRTTFKEIGKQMSESEAANVCTLLIFLAHSYILDETCPLRCWQKHIFRKYCTLKVLDAALFRLFNLRGFHLRLSADEESRALTSLLHTSSGQSPEVSGPTPKLSAAAAAGLAERLRSNPGSPTNKDRYGCADSPASRKMSMTSTAAPSVLTMTPASAQESPGEASVQASSSAMSTPGSKRGSGSGTQMLSLHSSQSRKAGRVPLPLPEKAAKAQISLRNGDSAAGLDPRISRFQIETFGVAVSVSECQAALVIPFP
eukprot:CAMPEP_0206427324 /NCGR_PEP_ID=MMETSP0324_2-20121206/4959_1 /ASSEMBLY_ACC=CAM_ASM_000836 /TAXON_ID=2866 /ORGANISM="Crypthecodinium cohnii, Strain Seligo" /LENGTH=453 /DNA_ID=CAMNT_0053892555 /DNA_START=117 /DNA_END=1475 /DNA_ORIENTATION=+